MKLHLRLIHTVKHLTVNVTAYYWLLLIMLVYCKITVPHWIGINFRAIMVNSYWTPMTVNKSFITFSSQQIFHHTQTMWEPCMQHNPVFLCCVMSENDLPCIDFAVNFWIFYCKISLVDYLFIIWHEWFQNN